MNEKRTPYPTAGTLPYLLLAVVALSGEFPTVQVARLPGSEAYKANVIARLKSENRLYAYYHTSDHHGEVILQLLCDAAKKRELDALLMEDLSPGRDYFTENDGFDEDGAPVLFGYTSDLPRMLSTVPWNI